MTTSFKSLPVVDLACLSQSDPSAEDLKTIADQLDEVFKTVGFAYLINLPLSFSHEEVFGLARDFFSLDEEVKMRISKKTFRKQNENTYRGYFPPQRGAQNLKEGFEVGPSEAVARSTSRINSPFVLTEKNVFPPTSQYPHRQKVEKLYAELQGLSATLLEMLAVSLGKRRDAFTSLLNNSVSTLRLLHYPAIQPPDPHQELNCTPHTDSGLVTILHQDSTGGLEVRNSNNEWIPAPYVPGSVVVNIGDLMAQMSGGKYVATFHRVRSFGLQRYSVPFFCEPGVNALVGEPGKEVRYEDFVIGKMGTWVEFQDVDQQQDRPLESDIGGSVQVGA